MSMEHRGSGYQGGTVTLLDILDKVLDKGLVVAGDIRVSLANVELLTIRVRLLVCSIDKAQEIGLDWWRRDSFLSTAAGGDVDALKERIESLERRLAEDRQDAGSRRGGATPQPTTERPRRSRARRPQE
jgi:gas vesicle protein GvpA/GvpJ/GvpM family